MKRRLTLTQDVAIGAVAVIAVVGFFGWSYWRVGNTASTLRETELEFDIAAQQLLATIGFDGMIHDFKNCVIRPGEDHYCTDAKAKADIAITLVDRLTALVEDAGLTLDMADIRHAAETYGAAVDEVRAAHDSGLSVREIDALVRYDDAPAATQLQYTLALTRTAMSARIIELISVLRMQNMAGALALVLVLIGFMVLMRREYRLSLERESRLTAVFSALSGSLIGLDAGGRIILANPNARALLRLGEAPLSWPDHLEFAWPEHPEDKLTGPDLVDRALNGPRITGDTMLMHSRRSQDSDTYVYIASAPVETGTGELAAILLMDDVTSQEKNRQQIERNSRLDALGQLTGGMAHDFNNLLATILYAVELAQKSSDKEKAHAMLNRALSTVMRGRELTSRLLTFAKRQPGQSRSRRVAEVFEEFKHLARPAVDASIALEFDAGEPGLMVHCDPAQLENALLNLVINSRDAIRFSGVGDMIRISARSVTTTNAALLGRQNVETEGKPGDLRFAELTVMDNGPGMSVEIRRRATDPFFTTKASSGGTGLGLAMVYGFVQQSRGEMQMYSDLGRGTTVRMILPRGAEGDLREAPQARQKVLRGAGETILLVEDETDLLEVMSQMLEDLGYQVIEASSGVAAMALIAQGLRFDILISDVVMPGGIDGIELARKVHEQHPESGIVLMSGYVGPATDPDDTVPFRVMQKPCMPEDLSAALRDVSPRQDA